MKKTILNGQARTRKRHHQQNPINEMTVCVCMQNVHSSNLYFNEFSYPASGSPLNELSFKLRPENGIARLIRSVVFRCPFHSIP